jgi:hypothetical protein
MKDWLRPLLSAVEKDDPLTLSATQQQILEILNKGQTALSTLSDETGLSYPVLENELFDLKRLGLAIDDFTVDTTPTWVWEKKTTSSKDE